MIIELRALSKAYGLMPVLKKIDLDVERGEFVALLGSNGSGKSTLLRLLCGLTKPTAGSLKIGGWELPKEAAAVRSQIGLVSHKALVYENLTARENLLFFARIYGLKDVEARIKTGLDRVGLGKRGGDLVRTYSRGMLQRLSIARALIHVPDVLLLDEPYTGLDQDASLTLDDLLVQAHGDGKTIFMVTHELDRAQRLAKRALILSRGSLALDAAMSSIDYLPARYTEITGMTSAR